MSDRFDLCS